MIDFEQLDRVADLLKSLPDSGSGLNFYSFKAGEQEIVASDMYPILDDPQAINFFFFVCMHNYGFWFGEYEGYLEPLVGTFKGKPTKGSDLLWKMCKAALDRDPKVFEPENLRNINTRQLAEIFSDDNGPVPFPDFEIRLIDTRAYGKWFEDKGLTPAEVVANANKADRPLEYFLSSIAQLFGYNLDLLDKKQLLLAMALSNRPEKFLDVRDTDSWKPIVDYHLMRLCLRLGIVVPISEQASSLAKRQWVSAEVEEEIRQATFTAVTELINKSGKPMSFVDEKMWLARRYCSEMEKPDCGKCLFNDVCAKQIEFFQPVFRTTAY